MRERGVEQGAARLRLMSSARGSRPFWSEQKNVGAVFCNFSTPSHLGSPLLSATLFPASAAEASTHCSLQVPLTALRSHLRPGWHHSSTTCQRDLCMQITSTARLAPSLRSYRECQVLVRNQTKGSSKSSRACHVDCLRPSSSLLQRKLQPIVRTRVAFIMAQR